MFQVQNYITSRLWKYNYFLFLSDENKLKIWRHDIHQNDTQHDDTRSNDSQNNIKNVTPHVDARS
jgi:hypothetical protein